MRARRVPERVAAGVREYADKQSPGGLATAPVRNICFVRGFTGVPNEQTRLCEKGALAVYSCGRRPMDGPVRQGLGCFIGLQTDCLFQCVV